MIDLKEILRKKSEEGKKSASQPVCKSFFPRVDTVENLKRKVIEGKVSEYIRKTVKQEMPKADISVPKMDAVKQFFADREYDDKPFNLEGLANMSSVRDVLAKEQSEEYMHGDEKTQTFHVINEITNSKHPYDAYFQRKRDNNERNNEQT